MQTINNNDSCHCGLDPQSQQPCDPESSSGKRAGYKKTKLGWIPEEWEMVEFGELFKEITNLSNDLNRFPLYSLTLEKGVTPKTERYERSHLLKNKEENEFKLISFNQIALNPMNLRYGAFFKSKVKQKVALSIYYNIIQPKNVELNVDYYDLLMRSSNAKRLYQRIATGTLEEKKRVHLSELNRQFVPYPKIQEQQKISAILTKWDNAIEATEKLIEAKQKRKKALMQRLLTGKIRFPEFVEQEWKEVKLGELFKNRKETKFNGLELLSVTANQGVIPQVQMDAKDNSNEDKSKYLRVMPGDIAYNTMRMWQGRCGLSKYEGIVSPAYTICTPKNNIDAEFMYYLFKFPHMIHRFWSYSQGIVNDTLNLKYHNFAVIKVKIPSSKEEKKKIVAVLNSCNREIELLKQKLNKLTEQKKGLMQKLLTGQVRVKVS